MNDLLNACHFVYVVICDWLWEKGHFRAYFQNRVIGTTE